MQIVNFKDELENLPDGLTLGKSNAFSWVTESNGFEFLTFRSAPYHAPSRKSRIIVLKRKVGSSKWSLENELFLDKDLREPRIVGLEGKSVFLYFSALKRSGFFNPDSIVVSQNSYDHWSVPTDVFKKGIMVYSVKEIENILYMTCYNMKVPRDCYFLKSTNGFDWSEVFPHKNLENTLTYETDFIFKNGFWYFVSCNWFGRFGAYGSEMHKFDKNGNLVSSEHSDELSNGPFLFEKDNKFYLVARRNLKNKGKFLLPIKPVRFLGYLISNLYYWLTPKKTGVWELDEKTLETKFVTDLPSNGDTSYASVLQGGGKTKIFYYSSPFKPIKNWLVGQFDRTSIYSVEIF